MAATSPDSREDGAANDFARLGNELYQQWEQAMTTWWDQVLESPQVLKATGENLSTMARARRQYEEGMDQGMHQLHLPTRGDLVRVTRVATLLEERLLQLEDRLLQVQDLLEGMERETLQARVEAAEARLELRERLAGLEERLAALEGTPAAPSDGAPAATAPTARKRGAAAKGA